MVKKDLLIAVDVGGGKMQDVRVTLIDGKVVKKVFRGSPMNMSPRFKESGRIGKSVGQVAREKIKKDDITFKRIKVQLKPHPKSRSKNRIIPRIKSIPRRRMRTRPIIKHRTKARPKSKNRIVPRIKSIPRKGMNRKVSRRILPKTISKSKSKVKKGVTKKKVVSTIKIVKKKTVVKRFLKKKPSLIRSFKKVKRRFKK